MVNLTGNALIRTRKAPTFQIIAGPFPVLWEKLQVAKSEVSEAVLRLGVQLPQSARKSGSAAAHSFQNNVTQFVSQSFASNITGPGKSMQEKRKQKPNHIDQFPFFLPKSHKITEDFLGVI